MKSPLIPTVFVLFLIHLGIFCPVLLGVEFPEKPSGKDYFVDEANLITPEDRLRINKTAEDLLASEGIPIITVTIPSLISQKAEPLGVSKYAAALFDHWGIGSQKRNYGILLLVSAGDREARIELGKAWAGLHDEDVRYIMDELIVPKFKAGDYSAGITAGVLALDKMARGLALPKPETPWWVLPAFILVVVLVIAVAISLMRNGKAGWGWALLALLAGLLFLLFRLASSKNSGSSFGGGSSGGGGASGKW